MQTQPQLQPVPNAQQTSTQQTTTALIHSRAATKQIEFVLDAPKALSVCLAGTFNEWDAGKTPLKRDRHGIWRTTLQLTPGRHQYRFVVDGKWISDPTAKESIDNQLGETNSVALV